MPKKEMIIRVGWQPLDNRVIKRYVYCKPPWFLKWVATKSGKKLKKETLILNNVNNDIFIIVRWKDIYPKPS